MPQVPPLQLGDGLTKLNPELRAAWDDALAKYQAKGVASKHRTAIPGKEPSARPKSARGTPASRAAAAARSGALTERLTRPTESAKIKHEHRLKHVEQIRAQAASHLSSSFQLYSQQPGASRGPPRASASKRPVHAPAHTPVADGILRAAAATEAAKAAGRTAPKGRGSKPGQEDRPWRKKPEGFVEKGKPKANPVPKFVDPDVTMDRWKKRWELKILNDPDLKVMRVSLTADGDNLSNGHSGYWPARTPSPSGRHLSPAGEGAQSPSGGGADAPMSESHHASVHALTAVHLIRENQRSRIKQYNQSLISTPTPRTPGSEHRRRRAHSSGPTGERGADGSPSRAISQDAPLSSRKHPKHDTSSFDAATRHIARQRAALAARAARMGGGAMKRAKSAEPARESADLPRGQGLGDGKRQPFTPELSKTMRAAGTAGNAKRGVKHPSGPAPQARLDSPNP